MGNVWLQGVNKVIGIHMKSGVLDIGIRCESFPTVRCIGDAWFDDPIAVCVDMLGRMSGNGARVLHRTR